MFRVNRVLVENYFKEHVSLEAVGLKASKDCVEHLHFDEDPVRIPPKIAHLTCDSKSSLNCVEIFLPMEVAYVSRVPWKYNPKIDLKDIEQRNTIKVPRGCYLRKSSELPRRS